MHPKNEGAGNTSKLRQGEVNIKFFVLLFAVKCLLNFMALYCVYNKEYKIYIKKYSKLKLKFKFKWNKIAYNKGDEIDIKKIQNININ